MEQRSPDEAVPPCCSPGCGVALELAVRGALAARESREAPPTDSSRVPSICRPGEFSSERLSERLGDLCPNPPWWGIRINRKSSKSKGFQRRKRGAFESLTSPQSFGHQETGFASPTPKAGPMSHASESMLDGLGVELEPRRANRPPHIPRGVTETQRRYQKSRG